MLHACISSSVTKYVSESCDCVDKTRKFRFGALLVETQTEWKVLKCEQVKIAVEKVLYFQKNLKA